MCFYSSTTCTHLLHMHVYSPALQLKTACALLQAVSYMDWNVGKVLKSLDQLGYTQNTVVAFVADHVSVLRSSVQ